MITYSLYGENIEQFGLYPTRPNNFARYTLGVSMTTGWVLFYLLMVLFSRLYYRFDQKVRIKSTALKGMLFGTLFLLFSQFVIALFNNLGGLPKESDLLLKSLSYLIAHLIAGLTAAYGFKLLEKLPFFTTINSKNNESSHIS